MRVIKRVLIVDEHVDHRRFVAACVRSVAHLVAEEASGCWTALRVIANRHPDLVILDMNLPVLSGYQTVRMVRAWGGRSANVPILALTDDAHPPARCLSAGATDYIVKPLLDLQTLRAKVRTALDHPNQPR